MAPEEERQESATKTPMERDRPVIHSKKVSDHLANERTFLAWIRTGLATITFGFVIERFGLLLRELGLRKQAAFLFPVPFSTFIVRHSPHRSDKPDRSPARCVSTPYCGISAFGLVKAAGSPSTSASASLQKNQHILQTVDSSCTGSVTHILIGG